ncbi:MAG TPA: hypothetical protein VFB72_16760 [Verrucomicrobiae bacterium]|nr:hypothetical protein [Verrucomicrobiae bacterium]
METTRPSSKYTVPFGLSLALCSVLNGFLVIAKEKSKAVSYCMQKLTGHHWITHVLIIFVAFLLFGFLFAGQNSSGSKMMLRKLTNIIVGGVVIGVLTIVGFYLIAD